MPSLTPVVFELGLSHTPTGQDFPECAPIAERLVAEAFEDEPPSAYFPAIFSGERWLDRTDGMGGPAVDRADVVYVRLPLSMDSEKTAFRFHLGELCADYVLTAGPADRQRLADQFRMLADELVSDDPDFG